VGYEIYELRRDSGLSFTHACMHGLCDSGFLFYFLLRLTRAWTLPSFLPSSVPYPRPLSFLFLPPGYSYLLQHTSHLIFLSFSSPLLLGHFAGRRNTSYPYTIIVHTRTFHSAYHTLSPTYALMLMRSIYHLMTSRGNTCVMSSQSMP